VVRRCGAWYAQPMWRRREHKGTVCIHMEDGDTFNIAGTSMRQVTKCRRRALSRGQMIEVKDPRTGQVVLGLNPRAMSTWAWSDES